jgi:hypothetical protein
MWLLNKNSLLDEGAGIANRMFVVMIIDCFSLYEGLFIWKDIIVIYYAYVC